MHAGVIQKRGSDVAWMASFIIQLISNPVLPDVNEIPILQSKKTATTQKQIINHAYLQNSYTFARYYDILRRKN